MTESIERTLDQEKRTKEIQPIGTVMSGASCLGFFMSSYGHLL